MALYANFCVDRILQIRFVYRHYPIFFFSKMSYYESPQWPTPNQPNWDHQGATTPVRAGKYRTRPNTKEYITHKEILGASGPQPQDDYAFSHQFDGM